MATIRQKDLKLLWGRAASRCTLCRCELAHEGSAVTGVVPLGEHAHIVAEEEDGPRGGSPLSREERNSYANLILLCPTCHTKIDKAVDDHPGEFLHQQKQAHEAWVRHSLGRVEIDEPLEPKVQDKWVGVNYPEASGIAEPLRQQGYRLAWVSGHEEWERVDVHGWQHVVVSREAGHGFRLKVRDPTAQGGYLVLLKKETGDGRTVPLSPPPSRTLDALRQEVQRLHDRARDINVSCNPSSWRDVFVARYDPSVLDRLLGDILPSISQHGQLVKDLGELRSTVFEAERTMEATSKPTRDHQLSEMLMSVRQYAIRVKNAAAQCLRGLSQVGP